MKHNCCQVSFSVFFFQLNCLFRVAWRISVAKGFIDRCVCDCSHRLLRWTTGKVFLCRHKMKYSCYQDSSVMVCLFSLIWVEDSFATMQ